MLSISGRGWSNSVMQASVAWTCESIRPGSTVLPCRSTTWVPWPRVLRMSSFVPTRTTRPPCTARAWWLENSFSTESLAAAVPPDATLSTQTPAASPDYPEVLGYEILGLLGHGGMGVVYRARQLKANRVVALKMLRAVEHATPEDRLRFQIETE